MATIGRYSIVKKLATGGMAEVYLAKVTGPGGFEKLVVLKQILPQFSGNELYVKMFVAEARLAAQLDHPNIVRVFDFGELDGSYFLTMEYVEGANLRQLQRWATRAGNPIAAPVAARIVAAACEGLAYAHEFLPVGSDEVIRLVHRDVSPENIMVSRNGAVKVLDFGIAKVTTEDNRSKVGSLKGKISYMPPEQILGTAIDHRVDVYALGVVLYQALSGARPYERESDVALITAILHGEPIPLRVRRPDLPDELLQIVDRATMKAPGLRYQSCLELRDALERYIAHQGVRVSSPQLAALVGAYREANVGAPAQLDGLPGSRTDAGSSDSHSKSSSKQNTASLAGHQESEELRAALTVTSGSAHKRAALGNDTEELRPKPQLQQSSPAAGARSIDGDDEPIGLPIVTGALEPAPASNLAGPNEARTLPSARAWRSRPAAPEALRHALRQSLRADRSTLLMRKLPAVIGRLTDHTAVVPPNLVESLAGVLDAAVLADNHSVVVRVVERAESRPGRDGKYAALVSRELQSPLRLAWLIEHLRAGIPADTTGLRAWLGRLHDGELLASAIDASAQGAAQYLFAEALAHALAANPAVVTRRLGGELRLSSVAALCFALERSQLPERGRLFQLLMNKGNVPLQLEVLTGRARAHAGDNLILLKAAMTAPAAELRKRAIELIGETAGTRGFLFLKELLHDVGFEAKPRAERSRCWAALLECGGEVAREEFEDIVSARPALLDHKKVTDAKLTLIEGLSRARTEVARTVLERIAADPEQGGEAHTAARAALAGTRPVTSDELGQAQHAADWRGLSARVCLDLALLARASTTVDAGSGLLDAGIEHLRDGLRRLHTSEGKVELTVDPVLAVNGRPVSFRSEGVGASVTAILKKRGLWGLRIRAVLPMAELRGFLLRVFDPDERHRPVANIEVLAAGYRPLTPMAAPAPPADPTARTKVLFAALVRWLHAQKEARRLGRGVDLRSADNELDEWARLVAGEGTQFMGVDHCPAGEPGTIVHALNTAALSMAFAKDLGLPQSAIREVCELSLMLGLAVSLASPERRAPLGEPAHDEHRLLAAGLLLVNRLDRIGTSAAVAALESGLQADAAGKGPGLLASIHALASTYDALTAGAGMGGGDALGTINGRLRGRFNAELLRLFTQWMLAQHSS